VPDGGYWVEKSAYSRHNSKDDFLRVSQGCFDTGQVGTPRVARDQRDLLTLREIMPLGQTAVIALVSGITQAWGWW